MRRTIIISVLVTILVALSLAERRQRIPLNRSYERRYRSAPHQNSATNKRQYEALFDQTKIVDEVLTSVGSSAQLLAIRSSASRVPLEDKLAANASLFVTPQIVEGFSCEGRRYGYYADTLNKCQIFHVCYPLRGVFPNIPGIPDVTYDFSFYCNDFLVFDQASLVCMYEANAIPCEAVQQLYDVVNSKFFQIEQNPKPNVMPQGSWPPFKN